VGTCPEVWEILHAAVPHVPRSTHCPHTAHTLLYSHTVLIHCTHTVLIHCPHTVLIHCTHTLYSYTVLHTHTPLTHPTHTIPTHTIPTGGTSVGNIWVAAAAIYSGMHQLLQRRLRRGRRKQGLVLCPRHTRSVYCMHCTLVLTVHWYSLYTVLYSLYSPTVGEATSGRCAECNAR
jgi:hypothetical protein